MIETAEIVEIELKGQTYQAKLDFRAIANIQKELKEATGQLYSINDILTGTENDVMIQLEVIVQSILRCHAKVTRRSIEDKLDFFELNKMNKFFVDLAKASFPQAKEGKQQEEEVPQKQ